MRTAVAVVTGWGAGKTLLPLARNTIVKTTTKYQLPMRNLVTGSFVCSAVRPNPIISAFAATNKKLIP